jgi:hypothetical protein
MIGIGDFKKKGLLGLGFLSADLAQHSVGEYPYLEQVCREP